MKVLVVDDGEDCRTLAAICLKRLGHQCEFAENGEEALLILNQDSGFEVVLTDLNMPYMDGLELTAHIRAHPTYSSIRVVMNSSSKEESDKVRARVAGVDVFICKLDLFELLPSALIGS